MLYKCANDACNTPFRRLREGKLFQVETEYFTNRGGLTTAPRRARPWRRVEHYWLCDACSPFVTLTFDGERGVITVPLPDGTGKKTVKMVSMDVSGGVNAVTDPAIQQTLRQVQK